VIRPGAACVIHPFDAEAWAKEPMAAGFEQTLEAAAPVAQPDLCLVDVNAAEHRSKSAHPRGPPVGGGGVNPQGHTPAARAPVPGGELYGSRTHESSRGHSGRQHAEHTAGQPAVPLAVRAFLGQLIGRLLSELEPLCPFSSQEPGGQRSEQQPDLGRQGDVGGHAHEDADRQSGHRSDRNGGSDAHAGDSIPQLCLGTPRSERWVP
jgi:hypothetical protein